jgi:uncharacterized RDD family membrane protein YckC
MENQDDRPPNWKIILAAILDFFTAFMVLGYVVAKLTGGTTEGGFNLTGGPALLLFALIIAYFVIGNRYFRGTLWKHIFGTAKPKA